MWKRREAMQVTGAAGDSRCFAKAEKPASRRGSLAEPCGNASWVGGLDASQPYHALSRAPIRSHAPHNRVRRLDLPRLGTEQLEQGCGRSGKVRGASPLVVLSKAAAMMIRALAKAGTGSVSAILLPRQVAGPLAASAQRLRSRGPRCRRSVVEPSCAGESASPQRSSNRAEPGGSAAAGPLSTP